ncbi:MULTISPECIES: hypothetical protein [unclassified Arenibacter]|jgi:putative acetyltransferase|nr:MULTISPECIES: hypothetical protein [unclassified Arenibacter]
MLVIAIREIHPKNNGNVARLTGKTLENLGVLKVGTAYADKTLDEMFAQN